MGKVYVVLSVAPQRLLGGVALLREEPLHESGVELAGAELLVRKDFLVQRNRGVDSLHDELAQGALHLGDGLARGCRHAR